MNARELETCTGRCRRTVFYALERMSHIVDTLTGEVIYMVKKVDTKWTAFEVDLDLVAQIIGTAGKGRLQREKHKDDRRLHKKALRLE